MSTPGQVIADRYRLVKLVGTGGMGVVWEAWDERLQRRVAVKQLRLPPQLDEQEARLASQRAMREARITARLHHQNAISVFDVVDDDGRPCLIMQFVPSMTLAEILKDSGPLQPHEAARLGAEVASALAAAHELGIVHRDVKPANVLVAEDGTALISDFGISQALGDASLTATGLVHGTPSYLSPEVARGEQATFASDVFGLGATLYAALEGSPPFGTDTNSIALLHRVAAGSFEPPRRSGVLTPVLLQLLAADPQARPPMDTAARRLTELAAGQPSAIDEANQPTALVPTVSMGSPAGAADLDTPRQPPAATGATAAATRAMSAAGGAAAFASGADPASSPARPGGRRAAWLVALIAVLAAVGVGAALVIPSLGGSDRAGAGSGAPAAGPTASPSAARSTSARSPSASARPSASPSSSDAPSASASASAGGTPTPAAQKSKSEPASKPKHAPKSGHKPPKVDKAPTKQQLQNAITDYYRLLPGGTDQAWPLMTDAYKADHTGGRGGYQQFWSAIDRVDTQNVTATPPDRAEATVTYHYKSGKVVVEQTAYRLVDEGGTLKIDASQVLNSSTR